MPETQVQESPATVVQPESAQPTQQQVDLYKTIEEKTRLDYENRFLVWKKTELARIEADTDDKVRDLVNEFWEKWKKEQQPPSNDQIQQMLSQEYVTFVIKLEIPVESTPEHPAGTVQKEFTVRELPQSVERKFYRQFKERLKDYGPQIRAFTQTNMGRPFEEQVSSFLEMFDNAFDVIADAVVLVLNPFGKDTTVTAQWVQENISSSRQWNIIQAQMEVNRLRDFFSQLYQAGQKAETMTTPLSFRGLQERLR